MTTPGPCVSGVQILVLPLAREKDYPSGEFFQYLSCVPRTWTHLTLLVLQMPALFHSQCPRRRIRLPIPQPLYSRILTLLCSSSPAIPSNVATPHQTFPIRGNYQPRPRSHFGETVLTLSSICHRTTQAAATCFPNVLTVISGRGPSIPLREEEYLRSSESAVRYTCY
jgi:hypothetical protein